MLQRNSPWIPGNADEWFAPVRLVLRQVSGVKMKPSRKLLTQEWFIFVCFMVFGLIILPGTISAIWAWIGPLSFGEIIGGYYQGLFTKFGKVELVIAWTICLGPYGVYLLVKPIVWAVRILIAFVVNVIPGPERDPREGTGA